MNDITKAGTTFKETGGKNYSVRSILQIFEQFAASSTITESL